MPPFRTLLSAAGNRLPTIRERTVARFNPKPHIGDPTYDTVQHMLNRLDRLLLDPVSWPDVDPVARILNELGAC